MKKERIKNLAGVLGFYLLIIVGVMILNARIEYINSVEIPSTNINLSN